MTPAEYAKFDALGLAAVIRRGESSPGEVLSAALALAQRENPRLNAIVLTMADEARRAIGEGLPDGPFRGVPFLLKDIGADYAGLASRRGSRAFDGAIPQRHSPLTLRYLRAGLVVFGKTATPELGNSGTTEPAAFAPCRNPWDLTRSAGGSSGGSAAAVAAGIAPMAHGGDGGGSLRNPASHCGLFTVKPTRARVPPGSDVFEGNAGLSVSHALTRSVRDCAALLDAVAGAEAGDFYSAPPPARSFLSETNRPPPSLRIGLHTRAHYDVRVDAECARAAEFAAAACENLGHRVEPFQPEIDAGLFMEINLVIWSLGNLAAVRAAHPGANRGDVAPLLEPITAQIIEFAGRFSALDYLTAVRKMHQLARQIAGNFRERDIILSPVLSKPPWPIGEYESGYKTPREYFERVYSYSPFCWPYNVSGQPAMSVPLYQTPGGLPVGAMFAARYGDEATLFQLAGQLEKAHPWRNNRPPPAMVSRCNSPEL